MTTNTTAPRIRDTIAAEYRRLASDAERQYRESGDSADRISAEYLWRRASLAEQGGRARWEVEP